MLYFRRRAEGIGSSIAAVTKRRCIAWPFDLPQYWTKKNLNPYRFTVYLYWIDFALDRFSGNFSILLQICAFWIISTL